VSVFYAQKYGQISTTAAYTAYDAAISPRYAVIITRHRTPSGERGESAGDGVQDADTGQGLLPAEKATQSIAALRSAGDDDFGVVHEAVNHGGGDDIVTEDFTPAKGLFEVTMRLARS